MPSIPTGTGDCCAPKLLHYGASLGYKPLAMAEFWFGAASLDKIQGQFYGACLERCQPLMGFLLSGLTQSKKITNRDINTAINSENIQQNHYNSLFLYGQGNPAPTDSLLPIIYQDEYLIAVNKPPGLLSVPGRYYHNQDSVISRLRNFLPNEKMTATIILVILNGTISSRKKLTATMVKYIFLPVVILFRLLHYLSALLLNRIMLL